MVLREQTTPRIIFDFPPTDKYCLVNYKKRDGWKLFQQVIAQLSYGFKTGAANPLRNVIAISHSPPPSPPHQVAPKMLPRLLLAICQIGIAYSQEAFRHDGSHSEGILNEFVWKWMRRGGGWGEEDGGSGSKRMGGVNMNRGLHDVLSVLLLPQLKSVFQRGRILNNITTVFIRVNLLYNGN